MAITRLLTVCCCLAACRYADPGARPDSAQTDTLTCEREETVCEASCTRLADDPTNCGRCGHSCLGGACTEGTCDVAIVATDQLNPAAVTADAAFVYWSLTGAPTTGAGGAIMRAPLAGGPADIFVADQNGASEELVTDATHMYWSRTADGKLMRVPLSGGTPTAIVDGGQPEHFVVDPSGVYFVDRAAKTIARVDHAGGTPHTIVSGQGLPQCRMATDGVQLFFSSIPTTSQVAKVNLTGGTVTPIATGQANACSVALTTDHVYFTNLTSSGAVMRAFRDGTNATPIATQRPGPSSIAVDGTFVYWTEFGIGASPPSAIMRAPLAGGPPEILASFSRQQVGRAVDVFVDDKAVYWVVTSETNPSRGQVMLLAKP